MLPLAVVFEASLESNNTGRLLSMNAPILPRYLLGSRRAILEVASSRWSLLVGAIFVLSAGFAREYDGEDLVHEPWHALRPLAASLATGTLLFLIVHTTAILNKDKAQDKPPSFVRAWSVFMGLFWMTAPMAWLYAIPYERFMSPVDAVRVNLWTLGFVAAWRVILMTRVVSVLYGIGYASSFFLVMLFADAVVLFVMTQVSTPVIDVMGGIRHSQRDALLASVTLLVTTVSVLSAPVWIIGALAAALGMKPKWSAHEPRVDDGRSHGLFLFAMISLVVFMPLLVFSQPEQMNRREAESLLKHDRVGEAFAVMSELSPDDYPPHWNPAPKLGYRESVPSLESVRNAMSDEWPADWVASIYLSKIDRKLRSDISRFWGGSSWSVIFEELWEQGVLDEIEPEHRVTAQFLLDHLPSLDEADRMALEEIVQHASPSD